MESFTRLTVIYLMVLLVVYIGTVANAVESLNFLVIGDMGGSPSKPYSTKVQMSVAAEMGKVADRYNTNFIIELGDNFYYEGVQDLMDMRFNATFEEVYTADSLQVPWYIIAGNHDYCGNVRAQIDYSYLSWRWKFPNYYYYLEQPIPGGKTVGFVMIDTIILCGPVVSDTVAEQPDGPTDVYRASDQWNFIVQELEKSQADYLFVAGHYPIYSIGHHGSTDCLVKGLLPLLNKYNTNGYLCGHDHNLQHLQVASSIGKNIDFFISGMANFMSSEISHELSVPRGSIRYFYGNENSAGGFLRVEAMANNMTMTFMDSFGQRLYSTIVYPRK